MFSHIDYVYAVYEEKSFTRAAEKLYISQPSLSATIGKLEKMLGYPIFNRGCKEVTPTYIGEKYIKAAGEMLEIQKNLEMEIDDLLKLRKGTITVGSTTFIVSYVLPPLLKRFGERYPDIEVQLLVEQSTTLHEKLEKGLLDFAIDNTLCKSPEYEYEPLFRERILMGVPKENPINEALKAYRLSPKELLKPDCDYENLPKVPVGRFEKEPFVLLKNGNKMRKIAGNIFAENHISPVVSYEFDQLMTSLSFAESGFGTCFLTDTILKCVGAGEKIVYYQPDTQYKDRTLYVIHKRNRYLSHAAGELVRFLKGETLSC